MRLVKRTAILPPPPPPPDTTASAVPDPAARFDGATPAPPADNAKVHASTGAAATAGTPGVAPIGRHPSIQEEVPTDG